MIIQPNKELTQAILQYQNGDTAAFDVIYYNSLPYITKCVLNVLNRTAPGASEELRQDIIQDTYMTIADKLNTLQSPAAFFQWAGQIATHHAQRTWNRDLRRQEMEASAEELDYELMDEDFIPEDILENREKQLLIRKMLDELPTNQYLCIVEYFYNGLKETEVAQKLKMPVNTVKTNLSRAKKKLKTILEDQQKKGIRLYSMGWLLLALLFKDMELVPITDPQGPVRMLDRIHSKMGAAGSASAAAPVSSGAAAGAASGAGHAVAGGVLSTVWGKVVAGAVAVAALAGLTVGGNVLLREITGQAENTGPTYVHLPDNYDPMTGETADHRFHYLDLQIQTDGADVFEGEITYRIEDSATGQTVASGSYTDLVRLTVDPGEYTVVVDAPRHRTVRKQVTLENRSSSMVYVRVPTDGSWLGSWEIEKLAAWLWYLELPVGTQENPAVFINDGSAENDQIILATLKNAVTSEERRSIILLYEDTEEAGAPLTGREFAERYALELFGYLPAGGIPEDAVQLPASGELTEYMGKVSYFEQLDAERIRIYMNVSRSYFFTEGDNTYPLDKDISCCIVATMCYKEEGNLGWMLESALCYTPERQLPWTENIHVMEATPADEEAYAQLISQAVDVKDWEEKGPVVLTDEQQQRMERILHYTAIADCGVNDAQTIRSYGALLGDISPEKDPFLKVTKPAQKNWDKMEVILYMAWEREPLLKVQESSRQTSNDYRGSLCYDAAKAESLLIGIYGSADITELDGNVILQGNWTEISDGKLYQPSKNVYSSNSELTIDSLEKLGGGRIRITCTFTWSQTVRCVYEAVENSDSCIGYTLTDAQYTKVN